MKQILILLIINLCSMSAFSADELLLINNYIDEDGKSFLISEVYIIPAQKKSLNVEEVTDLNWGKDLMNFDLRFGRYKKFKCKGAVTSLYDVKIVLKMKSKPEVKAETYLKRCRVHGGNSIVHHWIISEKEGSSPWQVSNFILKKKIKEINKNLKKKITD